MIFQCPKLLKKGFARAERDHEVCLGVHCNQLRRASDFPLVYECGYKNGIQREGKKRNVREI